ncbi:aldo/keto reductase [Nonomuraea terrae]|uniref:aldo/keto reductase n=1 Tax=Nonomuraea terrae TaxID=2530383 RepID=UPI001FEB8722|nr:aldo/keto reductase [Nonomuraea terrae]
MAWPRWSGAPSGAGSGPPGHAVSVQATHHRGSALISIRFGALREPGGNWSGPGSRPVAVKNALAYSLRRLGTDYVDVYQPGRPDPDVPIEETIGALGELVTAGYVRAIGLSEVSAGTLRRAHAIHPVADVQIEYSLFSRGMEREILPAARELGITVTAYGPLSRGLLSGHWSEARQRRLPPEDFRNALPRFPGANLPRNLTLVDALRRTATAYGVTVAQLAIAWVAAQGPDIVPLVGARTRRQLADVLGGTAGDLDPGAFAAAEQAVPLGAVAGERYMAPLLALLDSERP